MLQTLRRPPGITPPALTAPTRSPDGSSAIEPGLQERLEALLTGPLKAQLRFLPSRIAVESSVDLPQHTILKECFAGRCFQYTLTGMSAGQRSQAIAAISDAVRKSGLPLSVTEGGEMVILNMLGADKGQALGAFAAAIRARPSEIFKFGDKAGPQGNDRSFLRDSNSFNVGDEPAAHPAVQNVGISGPDGVLASLDRLETAGVPFKALACDFDGTLNPGGITRSKALDPRLAERFVRYARQGVQIAIITGRGDNLFPNYLPALRRAGLDAAAARNLHIYLFNGARPVRPEEWIGSPFNGSRDAA